MTRPPLTLSEALGWLRQAPDATGECDRCHGEHQLWALPLQIDSEPDAHWLYCRACYEQQVRRSLRS